MSFVFPVGTRPDPIPKGDPGPIAPDPATQGVTWYLLEDGSYIPGEGTYVDIVAQNMWAVIECANNIDAIIAAPGSATAAAASATAAAASATQAANSASAAQGSASLAAASATAAQTSATAAAASQTASAASAAAALASQNAAATSATNAATSATNAATSATSANNSWVTFNKMWYGPYSSAPTLDPQGGAPTPGDVYFDTTVNGVQVRGNSGWQAITTGVTSVAGKTGAVTLVSSDISDWNAALAPYATLGSPLFTGDPRAPTPVSTDNDTSIATTAFVKTAISAASGAVVSFNTRTGAVVLTGADVTSAGGALLASPVFTGNPTTPNPPVGDADTTVANTAFVAASTATAQTNVGRNLIHNATMDIAQRGVGQFTTPGNTLDRWYVNATLDTIGVGQSTMGDAGRAAIGDEQANNFLFNNFIGNAGATGLNNIVQRIENVRRLANKTVIVSFWANCTAGALKLGINLLQGFGTGGSPSASVYALATGASVTLSTTWTRFSTVITLPSIAGKTLGTANDHYTALQFFFSSGANNAAVAGNIGVQSGSVALWGVQLEIVAPGQTTPSPLEKMDAQQTLAACQRFAQLLPAIAVANYTPVGGQNALGNIVFPVPMRGTPVITGVTWSNIVNSNAQNVATLTYSGCLVYATSTGAGQCGATLNAGALLSADL